MKKTVKKLLALVCIVGVAALTNKLFRKDEVQEKLLLVFGDDTFLKMKDLSNILGDLLMWPVDFVRALLP